MKRFLIHVSTYWCGMDNTFRAEAESELELDEIADQLAYDNFQSYGCEADIAEEVIHTLKGENVEVNGYFIQKDQDNHSFYLTDLDVIPRD